MRKDFKYERHGEALRDIWSQMHKECKLYVYILNEVLKKYAETDMTASEMERFADDICIRKTSKRLENGTYMTGYAVKNKNVAEYLKEEKV